MQKMDLSPFFRHGLSLDHESTTAEETQFIEEVGTLAKKYHVSFPLMILAEGLRPTACLASSLLIGLEPFAELFFPKNLYRKLILFIEKRENIDKLINKLES